MIVNFLLNVVYYFILAVTSPLRLLDNVTANSTFVTYLTSIKSYLATLDSILPVNTIMAVLILALTFETAVLSYKIIMWIIRRIPGQG